MGDCPLDMSYIQLSALILIKPATSKLPILSAEMKCKGIVVLVLPTRFKNYLKDLSNKPHSYSWDGKKFLVGQNEDKGSG
jgi:hypothetical protein